MSKEQILEALKELAKTQGFYGRILEYITDETLDHLAAMNLRDTVDLVMVLEGC